MPFPTADIRWNQKIILPTLVLQFVLGIIAVAISSSFMAAYEYYDYSLFTISLGPLSMGSATIVSLITHIGCYFGSSMHPLVVLTFACEFMILWLIVMVVCIVSVSTDSSVGCAISDSGTSSRYIDTDNIGSILNASRKHTCAKGSGLLALSVIITVSYIWLIIYSAIVRKHTAMPFVPLDQRPLLQQPVMQGAIAPSGTRVIAAPATVAPVQDVERQRVEVLEEVPLEESEVVVQQAPGGSEMVQVPRRQSDEIQVVPEGRRGLGSSAV